MKATVTTIAAVLAITLGTAAAQATQTVQTAPAVQAPDSQKSSDVTVTGCVIQGSSPTVFILDNAKKDPASTTEKGLRFILAAKDDDVDLRTNLNKEVRVVGEIDAKVSDDPPTVPPDPEKTLPKFKAKTVTMVADTCTAGR
jgi:hypothetical protein